MDLTVLACPHCGDCIEIFGHPPPQQLDNYRCDCGAVLELVEDEPPRRGAPSKRAEVDRGLPTTL